MVQKDLRTGYIDKVERTFFENFPIDNLATEHKSFYSGYVLQFLIPLALQHLNN